MEATDAVRILCMEDDAGLARLLERILERRGHSVDTARDGEEGLALLAKAPYEVVLLDYHMPNMSGMEVLRKLAEHQRQPSTIMLTGEGNAEVAVEALKLGAADYIVKDAGTQYLELLPVVIQQVLSKRRLVEEREQMNKALRESEERYRGLVELSPDGIMMHTGGKLVFANPSAARYLGFDRPEDVVGKPVMDFIHPDFRDAVGERVRLLERQADCSPWAEEKMIRPDGRVLEVEVAAVPALYNGMPAVQVLFRDIKERKLAARRLEHMALYDGLTDLPNRTLFFDRLSHTLSLARRNNHLFAILYLDLDGFKHVNDTWGHDIGDLLLRETATRIQDQVRDSDTVARMGGDEFTVILTRIHRRTDPGIVAQKIIESLSEPFLLHGRTCQVAASIGISWYPGDGDTTDALVKKADAAMYQVKQNGKRGYRFASESSQQEGVPR
jgi:diguanylate cyclase (GGDEF)-like protein/PAS domain S-box-containing protein